MTLSYASAPDTLWVRFDDQVGKRQWLAWHDQRHRTYRKAASRLGKSLQSSILSDSNMDEDWFGRHMLTHVALKSLFPVTVGQNIPALEMGTFEDENGFHDWHRRHSLVHASLDLAFGVT